jgi:ABC-2 type transport system ATP-binding protein
VSETVIRVEEVEKTYRGPFGRSEVRALDGVSFEIRSGEVFGLLGPNGAGKTTAIKILLDLTRPTAGRAEIHGLPTSDPRSRRRVGYLPEGHRFPGYLTAQETLSIFGRMSGMDAKVVRERIPGLLERLGIGKWAGIRVKRFSKGMTQRLGIASALIHEPDVLFLDEPTDGVDPVGRREIRDLLKEEARNGRTIFLNSHLLSEVELMCDRVAMLRQGRIAAIGAVEELTRTTSSYRLVTTGDLARSAAVVEETGVAVARQNGYLLLTIDDVSQLNATVDRLRGERIDLVELTPVRSSLEDVFVDLVRLTPDDPVSGGIS